MKQSVQTADTVELVPGVEITRLSSGERLQGQYVSMAPDSRVDTHHHPNEQLTFVLDGELDLVLADERFTLVAGESLLIPGDVAHAAETGSETGATAFDVFSPPRDALPDLD